MPTPEAFGLARAREDAPAAAAVDWSATRARLQTLGANCFQLQRTSEGRHLFVVLLPVGEEGRTHRIEAAAAGEADAVRLALERAEVVRETQTRQVNKTAPSGGGS
jgi:hypothetical protein